MLRIGQHEVDRKLTLNNIDKSDRLLGIVVLGSLLGTVLLGHTRLGQDKDVRIVLVRAVIGLVDDLFHDECSLCWR